MAPFFFVMDRGLIQYLENFLTTERKELFDRILSLRTDYITIVLEDLYQMHNASAVIRTSECFGINRLHIIENRNEFEHNREISLGSQKWIEINKFNRPGSNTEIAIKELKKQGYRIVATSPHKEDCYLEDFRIEDGKFALLFGTELKGLSQKAMDLADEYLKIPIFGFTESFNISVSVGIILHDLRSRLNKSEIDWKLSEKEKNRTKLEWMRRTLRKVELLEKNYLKLKK